MPRTEDSGRILEEDRSCQRNGFGRWRPNCPSASQLPITPKNANGFLAEIAAYLMPSKRWLCSVTITCSCQRIIEVNI